MQLYNTLTRKKENFTPLDGKTAKVYTCGPTVYNTAHIGNMRPYICWDVLKKTIELAGFNVLDVMNSTDVGHLVEEVDDEGKNKVESAARKQNTTPQAIAEKYTEEFFCDTDKLNIRRPKVFAPATKYIDDMLAFIKKLEDKGFTYITSDGVYFDASKFANYNKLSRTPIEKNIGGARVGLGEKKNIHDFALWKFVEPGTMQKWDFKDRPGCPGWHIECSAIALKELGETIDIHTGGIDHIPIHHTNEITQSESLTGKPMSRFWLHNEFITVDSKKMSKSLGNVYTISDIESRGFSPLAFRYFCLLGHYRSILNFTWEGLQAAQNAYNNLVTQLAKHSAGGTGGIITPEKNLKDFLFDDLNTPKAIAAIWDILKLPPSRKIYDQIIELDKVLSLDLEKAVIAYLKPKAIPQQVTDLANRRLVAKATENYALADELRKQIGALGYDIADNKEGYAITVQKK